MEIKAQRVLPAPRESVWELLNDPDVLRTCIPGCEELDMTAPDTMAAVVSVRIGPIKARFSGIMKLLDLHPPRSYAIAGEGTGGIAGFAKGRADIELEEQGPDTLLRYTVTVAIGGKIAQFGSRLITSTSRKLSDQFFDCLENRIKES